MGEGRRVGVGLLATMAAFVAVTRIFNVDGDPRKGVVLDFFGPLSLWAQYAEGGRALNEWEIVADDYRVERAGSGQMVTLYPVAPRTRQQFPTECSRLYRRDGCLRFGAERLRPGPGCVPAE